MYSTFFYIVTTVVLGGACLYALWAVKRRAANQN